MPAAKLDLVGEQGASFYMKLTINDSNGAPVDLTGNEYVGQIRAAVGAATLLAAMAFNILDQTANKGQVEVTIDAATMEALPLPAQKLPQRTSTVFCYDIDVTYPDTTVDRLLNGLFTVSPTVIA